MEEKKKVSPILIFLLVLLGVLLLGGAFWLGMKTADLKDSKTDDTSTDGIICGNVTFNFESDAKEKTPTVPGGVGWTGGYEGMTFYLDDNKSLVYESYINSCSKWENSDDLNCLETATTTSSYIDTGYKCDYLFENSDGIGESEDAIILGACFKDGRLYEIGFIESTADGHDITALKPYIKEVTQYCKIN